MYAFDWKTLVNISLTLQKMVPNRRKHDIFYALYERQHRKPLRFPAFTDINLPGKCVFLAANSVEYIVVYSENANEQKGNKLFVVR